MKNTIKTFITKEIDKKVKVETSRSDWPPLGCAGILYEPKRPKVLPEKKKKNNFKK